MTCVEPGILVTETPMHPMYSIGPQELYDRSGAKDLRDEAPPQNNEVAGSQDEGGKGQCNLDNRFYVRVTELIYPGIIAPPLKTDVRDIFQKWIYVFEGKEVIVEGHVNETGAWTAEKGEIGSHGEIFLNPGPFSAEKSYRFFLTPVRLTDAAVAELTEDGAFEKNTLEIKMVLNNMLIALRDPLHWAARMHELFYIPRANEWQQWHDSQQPELFVAATMKSWIDSGVKVAGHLRPGEPKIWLDKFKKDDRDKRKVRDEACALLAHVVDSVGYRVIEKSCLERGGEDLEHGLCAVSAITSQLNRCGVGMQLAARLLDDPERIPMQLIFAESPAGFDFGHGRYGWLAALGIFNDLLPFAISKLRQHKRPIANGVKGFFNNVGLVMRTATEQVRKGLVPASEALNPPSQWVHHTAIKTFTKLEKESVKWGGELPTSMANVGRRTDTFHAWVKSYIEGEGKVARLVFNASVAIELANFGIALGDAIGAKPKERFGAGVSLLGASADLASMGIEVYKRLAAEASEELLNRIGGPIIIVSGACDAYGFANDAVGSAGEHDYDSAVGSGIAAGGAVLTACMGIAVTYAGFASIAVPPLALAIGAIGAALIFTGVVGATWFKDTPQQKFATHCHVGLTAEGSVEQQVKDLMGIVTHFGLERERHHDSINIYPGYVDDSMTMEVVVVRLYNNNEHMNTGLRINFATNQIEHLSGTRLKQNSSMSRRKIVLGIEPDGLERNSIDDVMMVAARIVRSDGGTTPKAGWLKLGHVRATTLNLPELWHNIWNPDGKAQVYSSEEDNVITR